MKNVLFFSAFALSVSLPALANSHIENDRPLNERQIARCREFGKCFVGAPEARKYYLVNQDGSVRRVEKSQWDRVPFARGRPQSPSATARACREMPAEVEQKYLSCVTSQTNLPRVAADCPVSILDAERGKFYVIAGNQCTSTPAGIGRGNMQNGRVIPGDAEGSQMTPSGLFLTKTHMGALFNSSNSVGFRCLTGTECANAERRGMIASASRRSEVSPNIGAGFNISPQAFSSYLELLKDKTTKQIRSCPFFSYFKEGKCGNTPVNPAILAQRYAPERISEPEPRAVRAPARARVQK